MKKQTKLGLMGLTAVVAAVPATQSSENTHVVEMNNYTEANEIETGSVSESETLTSTSAKFTGVYDTKAEAEAALQAFKDKYKENYNNDGDVTKIENSSVTTNGTLDKSFDTKEAAQAEANKITKDTDAETVTATVRPVTTKTEESTVNIKCDTEKQAGEELQKLKDAGYTVENVSIDKQLIGYTGEVLTQIKDGDVKAYYKFDSSINYVMIKQGQIGNVAVWTEIPLSAEEQQKFRETYQKITTDGSTSELVNVKFITGYKPIDLSGVFGNNWGVYTFSKDGDQIVLECPSKSISHLNVGTLVENNKYVLTGKKYKETTKYYVDYTKTERDLSYVVTGSANIDKNVTKYKVKSNFEKVTKEASCDLEATATKNIMETRYKAVVTTTTREYKYEDEVKEETLYFLSMSGTKEVKEAVIIPQTGGFDYTALLGTGIILSGAAVAANRRKKENN